MSLKLEILKESLLRSSELHLSKLRIKVNNIKYVYTKVDFQKPGGDKIFKKVTNEEQYVNVAASYRKTSEEYINELENEIARLQEKTNRLTKDIRYLSQLLEMEIDENIEMCKIYSSLISKLKNGSEK